ncbi:hypothetical protein [Pantoea sp. AS-PWVM4]|uniref:hypothetical protein n=1 Tax=Pantoea sp. AS-PWVM4 TaxID=1332069 RepID=UPI00055CAFE3|nr:hypothetical protein [Pantoea sp. AS-PWVM4]
MNQSIPLEIVIMRITQAQTVLSVWLKTLTTDDDNVPDMIDAVSTLLDGLANAIAIDMVSDK